MLYKILKYIKRMPLWKTVFGVFLFSLGLAVFALFQRSLSPSDIKISIIGPDAFSVQEIVGFNVELVNDSGADIHDAALFVDISDFFSFEGFEEKERRIELGPIPSKTGVQEEIFIVSKKSNVKGVIKAKIEYSPDNLSGKFTSEAEKEMFVSALPLTVILDIPPKAVSGQRISGSFHFVADKAIDKLPLFVKFDFPKGLELTDAEPALSKDGFWIFDDLKVKEIYKVEFEGMVAGEEGEEKKIALMFGHLNEVGGFAEQFLAEKVMAISSSPLEFTQLVNNKEEYIASPGENLDFSIKYKNKSGVELKDIEITASLEGDIFDFQKVNPGSAFFSNNTRKLIWNKNFLDQLALLKDGQEGELKFSLALKQDIKPQNYKDKNMFGISRARIESGEAPLALGGISAEAESKSVVKVRSNLRLISKAYYYEGPFSNYGPIPPKVGEKTTYTIIWQVTNTTNDVKNVRVEAPLPRHVLFGDVFYPNSNNFEYNQETHSAVWNIDALSSGAGSALPAKTIAFQVLVTPDDNMRGQTFELIEQAKISGIDTFTEEFLEDFAPPVNSSLPDDIGIGDGDGVVR